MNLMGKRVEQAARTVIGADPTLRTGEVAIPPAVAKILSVDVYVNQINIKKMQDLVDCGKCNTVTRNAGTDKETRKNLEYATRQLSTPLRLNDIVVHDDGTRTTIGSEDRFFRLVDGDAIERDGKMIPTVF